MYIHTVYRVLLREEEVGETEENKGRGIRESRGSE